MEIACPKCGKATTKYKTRPAQPLARFTCPQCKARAVNMGTRGAPFWAWDEADIETGSPEEKLFGYLFDQLAPGDLSRPLSDYQFALKDYGRKWAFDYCWVSERLAVEIDGGNHMTRYSEKLGREVAVGRHIGAADYEKVNFALEVGWRVLRFTTDMLREQPMQCIEQTVRILQARGAY